MFGEAEHRANLARLVELAGMVVYSSARDNKCGPRELAPDEPDIPKSTRQRLFQLAQHIEGAGRWAAGETAESPARIDAMDFPAIAFHVAAGADEQDRSTIGRIIMGRPSRLGTWLGGPVAGYDTSPEEVFAAWASEVRSLAIRLVAADPLDVTAPQRRPWEPN
ncbi:hypothetical protein [Bounagaea algeriensis]